MTPLQVHVRPELFWDEGWRRALLTTMRKWPHTGRWEFSRAPRSGWVIVRRYE